MAKASTSALDRLKSHAWRVVENWAESKRYSDSAPIHELAVRYAVHGICFEPLLSSAGLSKTADGFLVHINSNAYGVTHPERTVLDLSAQSLGSLSPQERFSVAHELAHAILLKDADSVAKPRGLRQGTTEVESLCNALAGAILLPKQQFVGMVGEHLFDAATVRNVSNKLGVSVTTFVLRLKAADICGAFVPQDGILAIARDLGIRTLIHPRHVCGTYANAVWRNLLGDKTDHVWEGLHLGRATLELLRQSKTVRERIHIRLDAQRTLECQLCAERLRSDPFRLLVGIRVTGHPENRPDGDAA